MTDDQLRGLQLLRNPFPPNQISYLPKGGVKLAYVGHAALTDRLLDADPLWTWEPLAMSPEGLPVLDPLGGMWIKLTVCGVTRIGYGHAGTKEGGDAIKEIIGDALRNAAMRFGAALDLWHKGDLHAPEPEPERKPTSPVKASLTPLPDDKQHAIVALGDEMVRMWDAGEQMGVLKAWESVKASHEEALHLWDYLKSESKMRAWIKAQRGNV